MNRFWKKVNKNTKTGCWEWTAALAGEYGAIRIKGEQTYAHRLSYEMKFGKIPRGLLVLHRCDNKICVNPKHLFIGTQQDNMDDKVKKNRQTRGETHPLSKISSKDVLFMRKSYKTGIVSQYMLADIFGLQVMQISRIINRKRWAHVN